VRLKAPTSNGNFISTLFVFRTPKFEDWRELDIEITADRPGGVVTNLIYANNVGAWNPDIQEFGDQFPAGPGARGLPGGFANQGQFHTYAIEWLPGKVTWFVDDVPVRVKMGGGLGVPEKSAKIMMNLWIFAVANGFGGDPTRNTYPMSSEYEWFRFYKWDMDNKYPCADLPGCLPAEDRNKSKNNPTDGVDP
jgi:beta-glucanase (GH16 family)